MAVALRADAGTGMVGTLSGFGAFMGFLLLATQLLVHLYASSAVTAAAYDAARIASGSQGSAAVAEAHGRSLLGGFSGQVTQFSVADGGEQVTVTVSARSPALVGRAFASAGVLRSLTVIDRVVVMRKEAPVALP